MAAQFHYEVVYSSLHDRAHLVELTTEIGSRLAEIGGVGSPAMTNLTLPFAIVVGTGGSEELVIERWEQRQRHIEGEPALVIVHRGDNSLAAALEAVARIGQLGGRARIVSMERMPEVAAAIRHAAAFLALRGARLGLVGPPSDWLVGSRPEPSAVRRRWGPTIVPVDVPSPAPGAPNEVSVELGRRWADRDTDVLVARSEVDRAAALHRPLVDAMEANDLDAITVRCFDLLESAGTSGCIALAELNTAGVVAGCEGDVPSALAMMLARQLFSSASWMANPARIDPVSGEMELAHCTVAPSLVDDLTLDTHFESGLGVGISGRFRRQPVTLVRIGGVELDQLWVADGDLVSTGTSDHLCRTQATVVVAPERAKAVLDRPLGNHVVLVPGHHEADIMRWWDLFVAP